MTPETHAGTRLRLDAYPCALPHAAPAHGTPERAFLTACNGARSFDEVLALDPAFAALAGEVDDVVWLDAPLAGEDAAATGPEVEVEPVLVLSAHPEDAWVSMGGWLLAHRARVDATVVSCFTRVLQTHRPGEYRSVAEVSAVRADEAALCARATGCRTASLGLAQHELRLAEGAGRGAEGNDAVRRTLALLLHGMIERQRPARVFAPAGIGARPDAVLLRDAVLELFEDAWFPGVAFHLYEDFPFSAAYLGVDDFLASFENAYVDVQPWFHDATPQLDGKAALVSVFRSRLARPHETLVRKVAERNLFLHRGHPPEARGAERFWTVGLAADLYRFAAG